MIEEFGYLYRICPTDSEGIQALVRDHVGQNGWAFGGAAQWDFVSRNGMANLRTIEPFTDPAIINVSGDFGHAFSRKAEVRWKRLHESHYDVLILSEHELTIVGAVPLLVRWKDANGQEHQPLWRIRRPKGMNIDNTTSKVMINGTSDYGEVLIQSADKAPISSIDYLAPNGAVQFQRLVEVL